MQPHRRCAGWPAEPGRAGDEDEETAISTSSTPPSSTSSSGAAERQHPLLRWLFIGLVVVLVAGAGTVYGIYRHLDANINSVDLGGRTGAAPTVSPTYAGNGRPLNILVIGSDSRESAADLAAAGGYSVSGARSDTTILLHLSADRKRAVAVSIPRDSWVDIPSCTKPDGATTAATTGKFNEAYALAGTACTIKTVQQLTQVTVDHYVVVDFNGFVSMVDALGGVPVCLAQSVDDPASGLVLSAGRHVVKGQQALAFVRVRHNIGDGSDLGRIQRQQAFLSGMVQKATAAGTLLNPFKLVPFLNAATKSLTTDPSLGSVNALRQLAESATGITPANLSFVTVPNRDRGDGANVVWTSSADALWTAIRNDTALPGTSPTPAATASSSPTATSSPLVTAPQDVRVRVLNGSGVAGRASEAAAALRGAGFDVTSIGTAPTSDYATSVVRYDPAYDQSGRTLTAAVPGATSESTPGLGRTLTLVVGSDYTGITPVSTATATATPEPSISARPASRSICG